MALIKLHSISCHLPLKRPPTQEIQGKLKTKNGLHQQDPFKLDWVAPLLTNQFDTTLFFLICFLVIYLYNNSINNINYCTSFSLVNNFLLYSLVNLQIFKKINSERCLHDSVVCIDVK